MKLDLSLHLRLPLDEAWSAFNDAGALARALPGATVVESDDASARGILTVDLGWASVAYRGAIRVEDCDAVARSVTLRGIGQGEAGEGLGELSAVVVLREERGATVADVALDVSADGQVGELMSEDPQVLAQRLGAELADGLGGGPASDSSAAAEGDSADALTDEPDQPVIAPDIPEPQRLSPMDEIAVTDAALRDASEAEEERHDDEGDVAVDPPEIAPTTRGSDDPEPAREPDADVHSDAALDGSADGELDPERDPAALEPEPALESDPALESASGFEPGSAFEPPSEAELELGGEPGYTSDADLDPASPPWTSAMPKAARTGSIPPPGWTPPAVAAPGGGKGKGKGKGGGKSMRIPKLGGRAKKSAGPADPAPSSTPDSPRAPGGLPGLLAKVRGALKR